MKKVLAISLALTFVALCFTACGNGKKKIDGAEVYTDFANKEYAVMTEENGDLQRDSNGNLIVAVTDEDGNQKIGAGGEKLTEIQVIDHALIIGNTIELSDYYITIPDGWSNNSSYQGIQLKCDKDGDTISIDRIEDKKITDIEANCKSLINAANGNNEGATVTNKGFELDGKNCMYTSIYIPQAANGKPFFLGYIVYQGEDAIYRFQITSEKDVTDDEEISGIIRSVQFK